MRYYECFVNTNSENIKKGEKIRLRDYDYDSSIAAINKYAYRNLKSGIQFFMYREEEDKIKAAFAFREDKFSMQEAYEAITDVINEASTITMSKMEPEEITTYQYIEHLLEGKRRALLVFSYFLDDTNEFIYREFVDNENYIKWDFIFEEDMVSSTKKSCNSIYDESLLNEISNIKKYGNNAQYEGNMVHYVISGNSLDATKDMAETLLQNLYQAGRIRSRRLEVIREMDPNLFRRGLLEKIIENNHGGAMLLDLTEKFGKNPVDYGNVCQYIEKLVKRYKNDCLFIFSYNKNDPGFSYTMLPLLQKHVMLVKLKEATCSKKDAMTYLKKLIKESPYSKYVKQAGTFFQTFQGEDFSQTDILEAFEKFEPWCMNHNIFGTYGYHFEDEFSLDRDADKGSYQEQLNQLIGLTKVKEQIYKIIATNLLERERKDRYGKNYQTGSLHMIFGGNPGSAKTTVAKIFAGLAKEKGILKSGIVVERGGMDYSGLFGVEHIRRDFRAAKGGVLFIDEAYELKDPQAIGALIQEMENRRDEVIVIMAGYNEGMKGFLSRNEGLKSRIPNWVEFPDYDTNELMEIFQLMIRERGFTTTEDALKAAEIIFDKARLLENFGNGRYVRNLLEKSIMNQANRLNKQYESPEKIPEKAILQLIKEDVQAAEDIKEERKEIGAAKKELDEMIGLSSAKAIIRKALASFKMNKLYVDKGIHKERPTMHMVFTGNPGTAKTTVARLVADILRDEKILPSGQFVEVGRADLVGRYVGETAPLVKKKFREAQGGVLFIDEAYALCDDTRHGYGDEAINTIIQEMENHRKDVVVIFAGYPKQMQKFLERNPGMASRVAFQVEFDDYSTEELCDIANLMLKKKGLRITEEAMDKLKASCEIAKKQVDYGNGRYVRKLLEEAEMNLAERLSEEEQSKLDVDTITLIEACDIEEPGEKTDTTGQVGFRVA